MDWTYFSLEEFKAKILKGESGYISGIAGVGKSYTMLQITKLLEEQGKWVKKVSLTHAASQNIGGQTCDSFLHKYGNGGFASQKCCLVIEEICCLPDRLLRKLAARKRMGVQFICLSEPAQANLQ